MSSTSSEAVLKSFAANDPQSLHILQQFLMPHLEVLSYLWALAWTSTALYLFWRLYQMYRKERL